jgi:hypothetical protein
MHRYAAQGRSKERCKSPRMNEIRLGDDFTWNRNGVAYQATQMPRATYSGSRISRTVKIRLYCSMMDTLMDVRLRLYVMILQ